MFGYLRFYKPDLTFAEHAAFRSIYCGLCLTLGRRLGQHCRLFLTYDAAVWAMLILATARPEIQKYKNSHCALHPVRKHAILQEHPILDAAADLSLVLLRLHAEDNLLDREKVLLSRGLYRILEKQWMKIEQVHGPALQTVRSILDALHQLEQDETPNPQRMAALNAEASAVLTRSFLERGLLSARCFPDWILKQADVFVSQMETCAGALAQWVYVLDACADWEEDKRRERPNPFSNLPDIQTVWRAGELILVDAERTLVYTGSQLPLQQHAGLVANLFRKGLPYVRRICEIGESLPRI